MAKVKAHFKVHVSIVAHGKTGGFWADPLMRGIYCELGRLAVARYADRTGDSFFISSSELMAVTGCANPGAAVRRMESFVNRCRTDAEPLGKRPATTWEPIGNRWRITLYNLAKKQGFGDRKGAQSEPTSTSDSTSDSDSVRDGAHAPRAPDVSGFVRMLKGEIPVGLGGETWDTPDDWLEAHAPLITAEAQLKADADSGKDFNRAFAVVMHRFWNSKAPPSRASPHKPTKQEIIEANVQKELAKHGVQDRESGNGAGENPQDQGAVGSVPDDTTRGQGLWKF